MIQLVLGGVVAEAEIVDRAAAVTVAVLQIVGIVVVVVVVIQIGIGQQFTTVRLVLVQILLYELLLVLGVLVLLHVLLRERCFLICELCGWARKRKKFGISLVGRTAKH